MATNTYVALQTQVLTSTAASITFSSIPQGYTDLRLVMQGRTDTGNNVDYAVVKLNNDATSLYSRVEVYGDGSSTGSGRAANFLIGISSTAQGGNTQLKSATIMDFMSYSNSTTYKTVLYKEADASNIVLGGFGLYRSTSAISTITLTPYYGTWQAGSTFTLYGIAAASVGAKATGGTIYQDASYFYHVFAGNGTFTPSQSISADVLVVAGGGGSSGGTNGVSWGPGGGAGQVSSLTGTNLTATAYAVTVGAGGAGTVTSGSTGSTGGASSLGAVLSAAAGYGGVAPLTGGAAGITYTGGSGSGSAAGGGAGSAANGGAGSGTTGGAGGVGTTSSLINAIAPVVGLGQLVSSSYYFAGGGGGGASTTGGAGGYGGGGTGTNGGADTATIGAINTGSGGGGSGVAYSKVGNGGSGVVIVRYAK